MDDRIYDVADMLGMQLNVRSGIVAGIMTKKFRLAEGLSLTFTPSVAGGVDIEGRLLFLLRGLGDLTMAIWCGLRGEPNRLTLFMMTASVTDVSGWFSTIKEQGYEKSLKAMEADSLGHFSYERRGRGYAWVNKKEA